MLTAIYTTPSPWSNGVLAVISLVGLLLASLGLLLATLLTCLLQFGVGTAGLSGVCVAGVGLVLFSPFSQNVVIFPLPWTYRCGQCTFIHDVKVNYLFYSIRKYQATRYLHFDFSSKLKFEAPERFKNFFCGWAHMNLESYGSQNNNIVISIIRMLQLFKNLVFCNGTVYFNILPTDSAFTP